MSLDASYVLQAGQMSAKSTRGLEGSHFQVVADYFRTFSTDRLEGGARVFYRLSHDFDVDLTAVNNFDSDYFKTWLVPPPGRRERTELRKRIPKEIIDNDRNTCFVMKNGQSLDSINMPTEGKSRVGKEGKLDQLKVYKKGLCNNRERADVVSIGGTISGFWVDEETRKVKDWKWCEGEKVEFVRGTHWRISWHAKEGKEREEGAVCFIHPGCSSGAFDAQIDFLSLEGWSNVYPEESKALKQTWSFDRANRGVLQGLKEKTNN